MNRNETERFSTLLNTVTRDRGAASADLAPAYQPFDDEGEDGKLPLAQYFWILRRYRWRITGVVAASMLITLLISARLTPIYEATATVDIDRQSPTGVVGEDAARNAPNDSDQFMATQIKLVESDSVLRPVDERLQLRQQERHSAALSSREEESPVALRQLKVTRPPNTYLMQIGYRSADPQLAADAANAITQSYLEHSYEIRLRSSAGVASFMERQVEELKAKMERSSRALNQFERELDVINPEEKTNILSARLLQLNTEYTNAQTERLKSAAEFQSVSGGSFAGALAARQGDALRKLVEHRNEAAEHFAEVQTHYGSSHPEFRKAQAQVIQVDSAIEATRKQIVERMEIGYAEAQRHEAMVAGAVTAAKIEFDRMNARSFEYQAVKRDADADKNLYEQLMRKIREAAINAGFQSGAIRVADAARPGLKPVYPNLLLNVMLAFLISALVAVGAAVLSDLLDTTVRDPEQVSRTLHVAVIGSLPLIRNRRAGSLAALKNGPSEKHEIPDPGHTAVRGNRAERHRSRRGSDDGDLSGFEESVRTLRNSILLANFDGHYRSLLVTSAAPGDGKTTMAANLAAAHAEQGNRTLLIDGDLRRPSVHRNFNLPGIVGLSNALLGEIPWRDTVIRSETLPNLFILPAGPPSRRASDLVGRGLTELLEQASLDYDLVILDAPPLLGFAEPLQMATAVDGVIVVARAGQTSRKAVASVLMTLRRLRAKVVGLVLNEVHKELSDSYYYFDYYRTYYRGSVPRECGAMNVIDEIQTAVTESSSIPGSTSTITLINTVIGIHDGHNASVAVVQNGRVVFALQEERITRVKNQGDAPGKALGAALALANSTAANAPVALNGQYMNYGQWRRETILADYRSCSQAITRIKQPLKGTFLDRRYQRRKADLREHRLGVLGVRRERITPVDHHLAHAAAAYYTCPWPDEPVLVLTCDGSGDRLSATVSLGERGKLTRLAAIDEQDSIGRLYALVTGYLGMTPLEHEYKVMGLAAYVDAGKSGAAAEQFAQLFEFTRNPLVWRRRRNVPSMYSATKFIGTLLARRGSI